jgi:23S rRNA (cytosine1962-C5)-methyltransferase
MSALRPHQRLRLRITAAAQNSVRAGHPWLFAASIREQNREGKLGELAVVYDRQDRFLAVGFFDPYSPIRVRVLHAGKPQILDASWWRQRLMDAVAQRENVLDAQTDACRLIHGENDGWPGLVLDQYHTTLVLKLYTAAWLPRLADLSALIRPALQPDALVLRLSRNIQQIAREQFGVEDGLLIAPKWAPEVAVAQRNEGGLSLESSPPLLPPGYPSVTFSESGLRFEANVVSGQKTGFFLDQRENRRRVEALSAGRDVLNAFSFSGGFSVYAARGGARAVTDLDISAHALKSAQRNFALNESIPSVAECRKGQVQTDAFDWLAENTWRRFGLIVLDPPSLAKRETERAAAIRTYRRLAADGVKALRRDGILVAASCSSHVSAREFFESVRAAAAASRRKFVELATTGHPPDHPATFPEAHYLKCIYLAF